MNYGRASWSCRQRGWITISECNYDVLERSYYLDSGQEPVGRFSDAFLEKVRQAFVPFLAAGSARVNRT
ncbi:hypothetical protein SMB554_12005 [Sinorhizobium meliloti]|nr:hypothetical protein SMB554_12005 [Sinorhizobium meliloti]